MATILDLAQKTLRVHLPAAEMRHQIERLAESMRARSRV